MIGQSLNKATPFTPLGDAVNAPSWDAFEWRNQDCGAAAQPLLKGGFDRTARRSGKQQAELLHGAEYETVKRDGCICLLIPTITGNRVCQGSGETMVKIVR